ncbi:hypothetical protein V5799_024650, partial [Amblyomma americanum]
MGLPDTYEQLLLNLEQDEQTLTTNAVKTRLLIEEKRKLRRDEDRLIDEESQTTALITKARLRTESKQPNEKVHRQLTVKKDEKARQWTSGMQKKNVRCFACDKIGHIAKDCDQFQDEGDDQKKRNSSRAKIATQMTLCAKNLITASPHVWHLDSGVRDLRISHKAKVTGFKPCEAGVETAKNPCVSWGKEEFRFNYLKSA